MTDRPADRKPRDGFHFKMRVLLPNIRTQVVEMLVWTAKACDRAYKNSVENCLEDPKHPINEDREFMSAVLMNAAAMIDKASKERWTRWALKHGGTNSVEEAISEEQTNTEESGVPET